MHWLPAIIHIPGITAFAELRRGKKRAEVVQKDTQQLFCGDPRTDDNNTDTDTQN